MTTIAQIAMLLLIAMLQADTGTVAGRVLSLGGVPQSGIRVAVIAATSDSPERDAAMVRLTQSDSLGMYRLGDIPPGRYFIVAGPINSPSYYPGSAVPAGATPVTVTAGSTVRALDFALLQAGGVQQLRSVATKGRVSGSVNDAMNQPIPSVTIFLTSNTQPDDHFLTSTNRQGAFEISGLPAGEYTLKVFSPLNSGYLSQGYEPVTQPVTLQPDQGIELDLRLRLSMSPGIQRLRPDLYGPIAPSGWGASMSANALTLESGEFLVDPRTATNHVGEVDLEVVFSDTGNLLSARVVDPKANPELARIAVEGIRAWRLRVSPDPQRRWTTIRTVVALYPTN